MTFPTIPTVAAGRVVTGTQADTSATRTFPSLSGLTKNAGDRLIAIVVCYQSSLTSAIFSSWGAGFTEIRDIGVASQHCVGIAHKISDGTETGTFTVTQGGTVTGHAAMILLSIPGAHDTTAPEVSAALATGTSAAADPASLNPAGWDAEDTLWIAVRGSGETATGGSFTGLGNPPTNYGDSAQTGISQDVVGGVEAGTSFRQLNAASEDVGAGTCDVSNARNCAIVIAVRPSSSVSLALTGVAATGAVGAFAVAVAVAMSGVVGTGSVGTLAPSSSYSQALTGVSASGSVGTLSASASTALSGVGATGAVGTLAASASTALTGVTATGAVGTLVPTSSGAVALTGVVGSGAAGNLAANVAPALSGVEGTGGVGTLAPSSGFNVALTGVSATGSVGTLTASVTAGLGGVEATGSAGLLAPSIQYQATLSGVEGTGAAGSLAVQVTAALTGVSASASVGSLVVPGSPVYGWGARGRVGMSSARDVSTRVGSEQARAAGGRIGSETAKDGSGRIGSEST